MQLITSENNELVKQLKRLNQSNRFCKKEGLTIAEGVHLAKELIHRQDLIKAVVIKEGAGEKNEISEILSQLHASSIKHYEFSQSVFNKVCPVEESAGILCLIRIPSEPEIPQDSDWVFLDDVQDPGNVGTIVRSSLASDVSNLAVSKNSAYPWSPKVLRAGMGAHFRMRIFTSLFLEDIKEQTKNVCLVADARGGQSLFNSLWGENGQRTIWVFGNEGQGVSEDTLKLSDKRLIIPLNPAVESLNVAMAATVCLFEQKRRREA
ncbi:TrmH family RNA methyltransferase [Turicimonas muris]|uniref:TrmH family RNA methyltransferase n=1 Tax=Turicimonas muris TaxID=1796652 RepID=UPI002494DE55|nr:RNA methyltransferase [Turicimonas muris]